MLLVTLLILAFSVFAIPSSVESAEKLENPKSSSGTLGGSPQNVTYRLLAIEHLFDGTAMKSAQWLIMNLTRADKDYKNWQNATWGGSKYTSYIHLLSYVPYASINPAAQKYYKGVPTNSNVVSEIQNFLAQTGPDESNSLTVRILYYNGHSGKNSSNGKTSYYMALGTYGSHPGGQSQYQELFDTQLDTLLNYGDLETNNCTLVMLDTCYSGGYINKLSRSGRVILTATTKDQFSYGWITATPAPGYWGWFTGHERAAFTNGSSKPVGLIGGIHTATDSNKDGWRSAGEVWWYANRTTYKYAKDQNPSRTMNAQSDYWVLGGGIPLVMYDPYIIVFIPFPIPIRFKIERPFMRNAAPWKLIAQPIHDWSTFHSDTMRTGFSTANGPATAPLWAKSFDPIYSSAAIHEGIVFVGTLGGGGGGGGGAALYALSWETGEIFWKYTTNSEIYSSPAVSNGAVIFGTEDGRIIALEEYSGMERWTNTSYTRGPIRSSPAVTDGLVFVGSSDGYIQAFNETTGVQIWNRYIGGQVESSPAVSNGKVLVGTQGGLGVPCLIALNEFTGSLLWSALPGTPVVSTPAVADNTVFVGAMGGSSPSGIYAFSDSGTPLWNYPLPGLVSSSPAVDSNNDVIIVGCSDGRVYAFNEFSPPLPRLKWQYPSPMSPPIGAIERSSPAISQNGLVYAGSTDGKVYELTESSGSYVWDYQTGRNIYASPAITDDHIIIGSSNGNLYSFGPPTPVHDIAVLNVKVSKTITSPGRNITITYTVKNKGNVAETIAVAIGYNTTQVWTPPEYYDTTPITIDKTTVPAGATIIRTVEWNTTGLDYGFYTISVNANPVAGETMTTDNTYVGSTVMISIQGDANGDKSIDVFDILAVKSRWGRTPASPDWIPEYDVNDDDAIDVFDILTIKANWGQSW